MNGENRLSYDEIMAMFDRFARDGERREREAELRAKAFEERRARPGDVVQLATKKIRAFRKHLPEYAGSRVYLGPAGMSFSDKVSERARKFGVGLVRQDGDSVEVEAEGLVAY